MNIRCLAKRFLIKSRNIFLPTETIGESKNKWSDLARKNAKYFIWSEKENSTDEEFRLSGEADYGRYVKNDRLLQDNLARTNAKTVLEISCGIGRMTEFFGNDFEKIYGIDIASGMIEMAKNRLSDSKFEFVEGNGVSLPFESDSVDFIFSFAVFQHMPSREVVGDNFKEVFRVLKPGRLFKVQLRGNEVKKGDWYYGIGFTQGGAAILAYTAGFKVLNIYSETEKYLWLLLKKEGHNTL